MPSMTSRSLNAPSGATETPERAPGELPGERAASPSPDVRWIPFIPIAGALGIIFAALLIFWDIHYAAFQ